MMTEAGVNVTVGLVLGLSGLGVLQRRRPLPGLLMLAAAVVWVFGGSFLAMAHRGPLTHLLLGYPRARLSRAAERVVVGLVYLACLPSPLAGNDVVLVVSGVAVGAVAGYRAWVSRGVDRALRRTAVVLVALVWGVPVLGVVARSFLPHSESGVLAVYDLAVVVMAAVVLVDLRFGRVRRAALADLAVDLGAAAPVSLRDLLAKALSDPDLTLTFLDLATGLANDPSRPQAMSDAGPGRLVTQLMDERGRPVALVSHSAGALDDPELVASVARLAGIAVANLQLQARAAHRVVDAEASRRRLLTVADEERARLEVDAWSVLERLDRAAALLAKGSEGGTAPQSDPPSDPPSDVAADLSREAGELIEKVAAGRTAVQRFARGLHPRVLSESGLSVAIADLVTSLPLPVAVIVPDVRFGTEVETAAYFVCAEALTNVVKYASASRATVNVVVGDEALTVEVRDDGVGGADPSAGTGLAGLADRLDVLHGRLAVTSPVGGGTTVLAVIPLTGVRNLPRDESAD